MQLARASSAAAASTSAPTAHSAVTWTPSRRCVARRIDSARRAQPYDVDVEPQPRAPDAGPGRWGAPPPPPPPPPPPQQTGGGPSRRDALFTLLGAALGSGGVAAYYNTQYDLSDDAAERALEQILEDPDFLEAIADEVLLNDFENDMDAAEGAIDDETEIEKGIEELTRQLEAIGKQVDSAAEELEAETKGGRR